MAIAEMKGDIARLLSISSFLSCYVMAAVLDLIKTDSVIRSADSENPILQT